MADQTSDETLPDEETSEETEEEKDTPTDQNREETEEPKKDDKFANSAKEAQRLYKLLKDNGIDPKSGNKQEKKPEGDIAEIVSKEVQKHIAPLMQKQNEGKVEDWLKGNREAMDYLPKIEELITKVPGDTTEERLENALILAKKDAMKSAGKKEMAFAFYQHQQASSSGGGASAPSYDGSPDLTEEERTVASKLGVSEENYKKRKLELGR